MAPPKKAAWTEITYGVPPLNGDGSGNLPPMQRESWDRSSTFRQFDSCWEEDDGTRYVVSTVTGRKDLPYGRLVSGGWHSYCGWRECLLAVLTEHKTRINNNNKQYWTSWLSHWHTELLGSWLKSRFIHSQVCFSFALVGSRSEQKIPASWV